MQRRRRRKEGENTDRCNTNPWQHQRSGKQSARLRSAERDDAAVSTHTPVAHRLLALQVGSYFGRGFCCCCCDCSCGCVRRSPPPRPPRPPRRRGSARRPVLPIPFRPTSSGDWAGWWRSAGPLHSRHRRSNSTTITGGPQSRGSSSTTRCNIRQLQLRPPPPLDPHCHPACPISPPHPRDLNVCRPSLHCTITTRTPMATPRSRSRSRPRPPPLPRL